MMQGRKGGQRSVRIGWNEFFELGDKRPEEELDARIAPQKLDDACTLIYTSGTTGSPRRS